MPKYFSSKQSSEEDYYEFDFSDSLGTGREIDNVQSVAIVDFITESDVTSTLSDPTQQYTSTSSVFVWIQNGIEGRTYKITVKVEADDGSMHELDGFLPIVKI